jgi:hypothetical protein
MNHAYKLKVKEGLSFLFGWSIGFGLAEVLGENKVGLSKKRGSFE